MVGLAWLKNQDSGTIKPTPNTSNTLYSISGIMKYEESDFDCGVVEL